MHHLKGPHYKASYKILKRLLMYLEVGINGVELLGMIWELCSDVLRADEDGLQMRPSELHLEPDSDNRVCC